MDAEKSTGAVALEDGDLGLFEPSFLTVADRAWLRCPCRECGRLRARVVAAKRAASERLALMVPA